VYDDFFQRLAEATDEDGLPLLVDTVVGLTLIMIHGAYETVAAQACWCLLDLIRRPQLLRKILAEQRLAWDHAPTVTPETLTRLPQLRAAVQESMRMRPAATVVCRHAAAPLRVGPYTIPPGSLVMICPSVAHRLPEVFSDPNLYLPERFLQASFDACSFVTFGGGSHRCLGFDFAISEIMVLLTIFISRFELHLVTPDPAPDYAISVTRPAAPCIIRYAARVAASQKLNQFK
jgi:sterol 14-demethylase